MTKPRKIKPAYTRTRVKTEGDPERKSKTVQSEKHASDINNIMARAHKTGQLPVLMGRPEIQPLPDGQTYQDALNKVIHAQQTFEQLPSEIRTVFDNDPKMMLHALEQSASDPKVKENLQQLGLLDTPVVPTAEPLPLEGAPAASENAGAPVPPTE